MRANDARATVAARPAPGTASGAARIAVLIPVHNAQNDLMRTLASLDRQSETFDVFVVDDGSRPPIALDPDSYRHPVTLLRLPANRGIEGALNAGLGRILADDYAYVARQDSGDVDVGERLARQRHWLDCHPEVALVGTWVDFVDDEGRRIFTFTPPADTQAIRRRMHYSAAFIHPATMIRTSALRAVGPYSDRYPLAEDYELFFRIARRFGCANLTDVLVRKEENPDSLSVARRRRSLRSRIRIQLAYFDRGSIHSYLGLLYSLILYVVPYRLLMRIKRAGRNVR